MDPFIGTGRVLLYRARNPQENGASMENLKIGQVAARAGLITQTIRYYEKQGLLPKPARMSNGYRGYAPDVVDRLHFIRRAKSFGFSLKEIRDLLGILDDANAGAGDIKQRAQRKLAQIEAEIADLQRNHTALSRLTDACSGRGYKESCPIFNALMDTNA